MKITQSESSYLVTECDFTFGKEITLDGELLVPAKTAQQNENSDHALIETLKDMMNGDAISDIDTFNHFVKDFIRYMNDMYGMDEAEVRQECYLARRR